ncbi:39S ribosomal protein L19 like protein [Argiope bruennichi]|uniref:39S ribosomal protein L19 like protein n=1 Tax=Argiope bruennichi TaxID=94029 RepID=A0A8T0EIV1_ARGBR|nr:39S ribosomal protein L19 like protein [Argiope bruennichi]
MSVFRNIISLTNKRYLGIGNFLGQRLLSQQATAAVRKESEDKEYVDKPLSQLAEYRFIYPEFLPDPKFEFRNKVREKLEREDMLKRRTVIDIPEFYVGFVLAVFCSDPFLLREKKTFFWKMHGKKHIGVKLNPPPWFAKWEQRNLKGIEPLGELHWKRRRILRTKIQPMQVLDNYDLMKQYRRSIPEEDQQEIWEDVDKHKANFPARKQIWKRALQKAKPKPSS